MNHQLVVNSTPLRGQVNISQSVFLHENLADYESGLWGIFEGKRKKAKADAFVRQEEARRATFLAQVEAQKQGYDPDKPNRDTKIVETQATIQSEKNLYTAMGLIVVAAMVGLYFIKRK